MNLENKIKLNVHEQEMQAEIQKQLRMMPGQEKMFKNIIKKSISFSNLRGSIYEEKIINEIKKKAKQIKKKLPKMKLKNFKRRE